ncbi:MAG: ThiF family adenylyltransferase [Acidobacteriota bacterium]
MSDLRAFLAERAIDGRVAWTDQVAAMDAFGLSCAEAERAILDAALLPARYQRNQAMLTTGQQRQLFDSVVAVAGLGGLGGYIIEELARLGVGSLVAIDPDVFVEHNLNRQLLSAPSSLGISKVDQAVARVAGINPAVTVRGVRATLTEYNARDVLTGATVVADALDSAAARLDLAAACRVLDLPFVHGAIGGWYGNVTTVWPGDSTLDRLYPDGTGGRGIESDLGNPSFTPAIVGSLQVAEICKVLLGIGEPLRQRILSVDLFHMEVHQIRLE